GCPGSAPPTGLPRSDPRTAPGPARRSRDTRPGLACFPPSIVATRTHGRWRQYRCYLKAAHDELPLPFTLLPLPQFPLEQHQGARLQLPRGFRLLSPDFTWDEGRILPPILAVFCDHQHKAGTWTPVGTVCHLDAVFPDGAKEDCAIDTAHTRGLL